MISSAIFPVIQDIKINAEIFPIILAIKATTQVPERTTISITPNITHSLDMRDGKLKIQTIIGIDNKAILQ